MLQKVNTHKIEQLAGSLDQVRRSVEYSNVGLSRELSRLLSSVESEYSEPGVRSAVREVRERLQKMMRYSGQLDDHLRGKVRGLQSAVNQYLQAEKSVLALTQVQKPTAFTLKGGLQGWLSRFRDNAVRNVAGAEGLASGRPSIFQLIKGAMLEAQELTLQGRLASVKEDARIGGLLETLNTGSVEEQRSARAALETIAKSFEEIARSQTAYRIYEKYENSIYTDHVHKEADKYREALANFGVSAEWFREGASLTAFAKGSPLAACQYNPLKQDFSPMPEESELRLVITAGLLNAKYRDWARKNYEQIKKAVLEAADQRRQLQRKIEDYNIAVPEADIRRMQQALKDMNLFHGEVTGKYNLELLIAVAGYQNIANNYSSVAAVRRELFNLNGYQFTEDGKITKELLNLAMSENAMGMRNNPDLKSSGRTAMTAVGVGEGVVKQLYEDGEGMVQTAISLQPTSPKFWTETIPGYYDLGKAIASGDITYEDIKGAVKDGLSEEYIVPFKQVGELSDKVLSGEATYEESVTYGRALTKAAMAVMIVGGAAKTGAKLSAKTSQKLAELMPKLGESMKGLSVTTPEGLTLRISGKNADDIKVIPKTEVQDNYLRYSEERKQGAGGTPKADIDNIRESAPDYYRELIDKHGDKGRYFARSPEEYESLAKDPAKNFKINEKSKIERIAGLELEARGDLPGPIVRDTNPAGAEFIDSTGVKWDVKGWYSKFAPKGYTLEKAIADIEESLSKGENVIIDTSKMFPEHIDEVRAAVKELGLSDKLLWWP